jgi:hypothetical protein
MIIVKTNNSKINDSLEVRNQYGDLVSGSIARISVERNSKEVNRSVLPDCLSDLPKLEWRPLVNAAVPSAPQLAELAFVSLQKLNQLIRRRRVRESHDCCENRGAYYLDLQSSADRRGDHADDDESLLLVPVVVLVLDSEEKNEDLFMGDATPERIFRAGTRARTL